MIREWLSRAWATLRQRSLDRQSEAEMQFHLDMETQAAMDRGASHAEAMRLARLRAGSIPAALDEVRDQRGPGPFAGMTTDLRQALSALRRDPGFTFIAAGALALAVTVSTLVLALFGGVILRPLPYPEPERLVRIFEATPRNPKFPLSIANYEAYKRETGVFESVGLYTGSDVELSHESRPERLRGVRISADFLPALGVRPAMGRKLEEADTIGPRRNAILSHPAWRDRFRSDPNIVGKTIRLNREAWQIVGVMPAGFQYPGGVFRSPLQGETVDVYLPTQLDLSRNARRYWHFHNAVGRLKPGVTLAQARQAMSRFGAEMEQRDPEANRNMRPYLSPLIDEVVGKSKQTVWLLLSAGALVLLLACANIAALCVARGLSRRGEMAVRQALGAGAWRQVRATLAENLWLGVIGGVAGVALAFALLPLFRAFTPRDFPRVHELGLGFWSVTASIALAMFTSVAAGLIPASRNMRIAPALSRRASANRHSTRLQTLLVAGQLSFASVLCVCALLLLRSSILLGQRDHGFDPAHVLTFELNLPGKAYEGGRATRLWRDLEERWSKLPGVIHAGLGSNLPWTGYDDNSGFEIVGRPRQEGESRQARFQSASPGMFAAMKMRLLQGRLPTAADHETAPPVVVINEALAKRHFPSGDAVGQVLDYWGKKREIIGVVSDIRDRPADGAAEPAIWWPLAQQSFVGVVATIRTSGDPMTALDSVRRELAALDPELPLANVRPLERVAEEAHAERRFAEWLVGAFAALAALLAAFGIYCLMSFIVRQRRRELAIRVALGASPSSIAGLLMKGAVVIGLFGIAAGLVFTPLAGRLLSGMLFGVRALDGVTLLAVPPLMAAILLLAILAPVASAAGGRVLSALREE